MINICTESKERLEVIAKQNRDTLWLIDFMNGEPDTEDELKPELEDMQRKLTEVGVSLQKLLGKKIGY